MALTDVKSEQIQSSVALAGSPTTTTQSASDNSTKIATTAYVETAVANLVASAPAALNTLDELAAALNDDASFSTTVTNSIATKLPLAGGTLTGALTGTTASFSTASTSASVFTLTDTGVAAYEVIFPDTSTYQLTTNTTSDKTFKLLNSGSGTFNLNVEGSITSGTGTFAGGAANNNDDANILTLNASQHARLLVDTSSTSGHRATLALESNGNELTLSTTGSASYLTSVGTLAISGGDVSVFGANRKVYVGESGAGGTFGFIGWNDASNYLYLGNSYNSAFNTDLVINSSGNIGIGNSNPAAGKLVITASSNGGFGGNLIIENSNASDTDKVAIALRPNGSATTALGSYGEIRIIGEYDSGSTNGASNLQFWTHSGNGTVSEAMRIGSTGHVAIGANPDLTKFVVEADYANWTGRFKNTNAGAYGLSVDLSQSSAAGGQANVYAFATYTPANTGFVITKNGSVGIRTATPGSRALNVLGNDNQIVIDGNGSSANSGLFFAEQGTDKWEVYHRGVDDTFRIYNYATSSPNIQISAAGAVTKEKQPYVQGRGNAGWSATGGSAQWNLQPHGNTPIVSRDHGNNYSTSNKRFTCPVDGVYLVEASWYIYQTAAASRGAQYVHPAVFKNGSSNWNGGHQPYTIMGHMMIDSGSGAKHYDGVQMSFTIYCSASDYLEIYLYSPNSNPQSYENYHYFSYTLLG